MNTEWHDAMDDWHHANDDSASIDTAIEALGMLIATNKQRYPDDGPLLVAAAALIPLYIEFGTDPDGEATARLYEEAKERGWQA